MKIRRQTIYKALFFHDFTYDSTSDWSNLNAAFLSRYQLVVFLDTRHSGYYPVAWTNRKYRVVYFNMGHNDIDYEHGTNKELSFTFDNASKINSYFNL